MSNSRDVAAQHFDLAAPAELFDIASGSSDGSGSAADELDDAFWWAELQGSAAPESPGSELKRPHSPGNESSPSKRKRPG